MNAKISPDEFPVIHRVHPDIGLEYIQFDVPNGWDDVKKVCKKALVYDGRKFGFSCWDSDKLICLFRRPLDGSQMFAHFEKLKKS